MKVYKFNISDKIHYLGYDYEVIGVSQQYITVKPLCLDGVGGQIWNMYFDKIRKSSMECDNIK